MKRIRMLPSLTIPSLISMTAFSSADVRISAVLFSLREKSASFFPINVTSSASNASTDRMKRDKLSIRRKKHPEKKALIFMD